MLYSSSPGDTITFDPSIIGDTIYVDSILTLSHDITLMTGGGFMTISGFHNRVHTLVKIAESAQVSISNIIFQESISAIVNDGDLTLNNVRINHNHLGILNVGNIRILDCLINSNTGNYNAGGIIHAGGYMEILNSIITGNEGCLAGAIISESMINITNSVITGNLGMGDSHVGAGALISFDTIVMTNCTVAANTGRVRSVGLELSGHSVLTNNVVARNTDTLARYTTDIQVLPSGYLISNSNLIGDASGANLFPDGILIGSAMNPINPLFVDSEITIPSSDGNFRILCNSPSVNAGINSAISSQTHDLDGMPRIIGPTVDLGAYEGICCSSDQYFDGSSCIDCSVHTTFDNFEGNNGPRWGNWNDGGRFAGIANTNYTVSGQYSSAVIDDHPEESTIFSDNFSLEGISEIYFSFTFVGIHDQHPSDRFFLEISTDDQNSWTILKTYTSSVNYNARTLYSISESFDNLALTNTTSFRFRCEMTAAISNTQGVIFDDIKFSVCPPVGNVQDQKRTLKNLGKTKEIQLIINK